MKTVEDFTEFEQRAAYFDGIPADAARKGTNVLERGSQVHFMAEFQALLDFPPAPKLNVFGKLNSAKASESEMRGQEIFFGKGQCASCHTPAEAAFRHPRREFTGTRLQGRHVALEGLQRDPTLLGRYRHLDRPCHPRLSR